MRQDRARGALLGLAVGDALGTTYEFEKLDQPAYPQLAVGPAVDVVGGGPFGVPAGAITDDTQMAVCLARSLAERGRFDAEDAAKRYVAWAQHAFDIGNQTSQAISALERGMRAGEAGLDVWRRGGRRAAGNGSLMRTAPIGVALAAAPGAMRAAAMGDAMITHADPRCALACAGFDAAIAAAVRDAADAAGMVAAARASIERGEVELRPAWESELERQLAVEARDDVLADLGAGDPAFDRGGFVRTALRLAFWHLRNTATWRDALVDVASRGGDADTNAAITGALLGARDGEAAIPEAWRLRVLSARQKGDERWGAEHHPRHLLALVE